MSPYVILSAVASFAAGSVATGVGMQMLVSTQVTCATVARTDPPLPSTLFNTQPIPKQYKNW